MKLAGKVVVITGASQGIGAACAAEFLRAGARLSLSGRSEERLRQVAGDGLCTAGDLTDPAVRRLLVDRTLERYGAIDVLINNAGVGLYRPAWETPLEEVRALMELNFFAALGLTQLVVPHMRQRRSGMIVNVGSIASKLTLPWMTIYSASKGALDTLTDGLRMELLRDGVRTMLVCPGYVKTGFQKNVLEGQPPEKVLQGRKMAITPEECAVAIRRGVERNARTVHAPHAGWLLVAAMRLFPSMVERRMAQMNGTA
ncbi:MAG TPA: SDR family NAD(P)-dependent oxidoreductase [Candidatus Sulfopaludibacter sp.]|nr:SDR family NAD(P)-dependent oxidoreductase [Candidatus Sulfopaludibacter sp.]